MVSVMADRWCGDKKGKSGYAKNRDNAFSSEYFVLFLLKRKFSIEKNRAFSKKRK